ncbi:MAG TPA: alpha/beta hydrolase [Rugosimonospora sp.]|nr:alpha/beta hydrolase [Rugosimonospora sp.]
MVTEERLRLADGEVHLLRGGTGPAVLFLHAAGGAGRWFDFHRRLAERFDVFAPDHPGFGGSDEFPAVEAMDDLVYHYLDLIERLGLDRPHIVGGSFGGWLAAELAVAAPQAIGSLVLLSPIGLRLPGAPVADLFLMTPPQVVAALFHDPDRAGELFPGKPDTDGIIAAYRDMTALARFCWVPFMGNPKLDRRLHRITAPTLVAWPEQDAIVPIAHGHRYTERIPGARFATVADCGHAMYFERPAEFAGLVTDFLAAGAELDGARR